MEPWTPEDQKAMLKEGDVAGTSDPSQQDSLPEPGGLPQPIMPVRPIAGAGALAGGTQAFPARPIYPDVDPHPMNTHPGAYFGSPADLLTSLRSHIDTTHGLAVDKEVMTKVYEYLSYHFKAMGLLRGTAEQQEQYGPSDVSGR